MNTGSNQKSLINNNMANNKLLSTSGKKKMLMNIDNNKDYSDSDENNNENNKKAINDNFISSNLKINDIGNNRIKRFNLNRINQERPEVNRFNLKKNFDNNINYNHGYSGQLNNNNYFLNNNYNNTKRSFSGEKNYKPKNNLYDLVEERKFNSINRITTSYNSKKNSSNVNISSNFPPTNANTKVIKLPINSSVENNSNLYPTFNEDNIKNNFNRTFNTNYNNITGNNNYHLNQTQNFNSNNRGVFQSNPSINNISPDYELERGNKTIGYLTYKNQNQLNNFNDNSFQGYQIGTKPGIINLNKNSIDDDDDDGRFHELSVTKNFSRFNKTSPFNKSISFEQALKQQQININNLRDNNQIGRNTFVKKLPPLNEENNKMNVANNNPFKRGISGPVLNNQMKSSNLNKMINFGDSNDPGRNYSFGNNINIKRLPSETNNNVNNNILLKKANEPINNIIPNAAFSFNSKNQNLNELNNNNIDKTNHILPSRNININLYPQEQTPIINNLQQINYNKLNNQKIPQREIIESQATPSNLEENQRNEANTNIEEENKQNDDKIEQKEENAEKNEEGNKKENEIPNKEQDEEQNNENQDEKEPNISYNEFDWTGLLKNYGGLTQQGIDSNGNQKINQDTLVSLTNINKIKDFNIFGVLDGHGPEGHHVSQFASEFIPGQIINNPEIKQLSEPELIYQKLKENNCQIITEAFLLCDEQLKKVEFDAFNSGSTCILIIHIGQHILCANVGDSRAFVAYDDNNEDQDLNYLEEAQLSIDYKPDLEEEKNRILLSGGTVEQMQNQFGERVGPFRVWVKSQDYPGLAMSRSIGDLKAKTIGVISEPGVLEYDINETTKFIVLASDGVWEFMKNEDVRNIGKSFYLENNTSALCHEIVDTSASLWKKRDIVMDDITVVVMFF